ncbi:hypothetical protein D3C78_1519320 [compost metagenome]
MIWLDRMAMVGICRMHLILLGYDGAELHFLHINTYGSLCNGVPFLVQETCDFGTAITFIVIIEMIPNPLHDDIFSEFL